MTASTYLFYDIESTGLNKCFDQVLQFAAIRTDLSLNEIDRTEIQVKLNADVIPSPGAVITHRIGIGAMQNGVNEIEAIKKIHALLNTPGTISVGYNTLGFDDEFLRFSFYRNLLPPYTHQFANQCGRMDIYPITVMYYLFKNEVLNWPSLNGKVSLKLDQLIKENDLAAGQAHNAMVDVEATLALAKKLYREEKMWHYLTGCFDKKTDLKRQAQLEDEGIMVVGNLGTDLKFHAPVISLGQHQHYKNQSLWLRLDTEDLQNTTAETIAENTYVIKKRAAEQQILLPPRERFLKHLSEERLQRSSANKAWLQANPNIFQLICDYHQHYKYPDVPNIDPDAALYSIGFPSSREENLFKQFHEAPPQAKETIADQFPNQIRREQAMRILARFYPETLSENNEGFYNDFLNAIRSSEHAPVDYRGKFHLTHKAALQSIATLRDERELDEEQVGLLDELEGFLVGVVG